jgi:hypothetical protein
MASILERAESELAARQAQGQGGQSTIERAEQELEKRQFDVIGSIGRAGKRVGQAVIGAVKGQQDPAFEGVPGFNITNFLGGGGGIQDKETLAKIARAKVLGVTDEVFGRLIKEALGDRLTNVETDKFGQEVITYIGDDGVERREFINKPGLEGQDIDRVFQNSFPFLLGGGVASTVGVKLGAGLLARTGLQTVGQIGASVGQDVAAGETPDVTKALLAGAGGAVGEVAAPVVSGLINKFRTRKGLITPDGVLTERGRQAFRDAGVDPAQASDRLADLLRAPDVAEGAVDTQAIMRAQQEEFGISSSFGQRSLDPEALSLEKQARQKLLGDRAFGVATEFDEAQRQQIISAVDRETARLGTGVEAAAPEILSEAGERLQGGLRAEIATQEAGISKAFGEVDIPEVFPQGIPQENFDDLAAGINERLGTRTINNRTPAAADAVALLDDFSKGTSRQPEQAFLQRGASSQRVKPPLQNFDDVRRAINDKVAEAANPTDTGAMLAIKRGYNEWIADLADGALESANPEQFAKLQAAIGLTAEVKQLFQSRGPKDFGGKILEKIATGSDSPEGAIQALFQSGFTGGPKAGAVDAAKRLKTALVENQPEAWHAMRQALWLKMARTKTDIFAEGKISRGQFDRSLGQIHRNITDALKNQKSLMDVIYTPAEQTQMRKFASVVRRAQSKDPNPSGTAGELQRMKLRANDNVFVNLIKREAASQQLAKNSVRAAFFRKMAKVAAGSGTRFGEARVGELAARRFSGKLPTRSVRPSPRFLGPAGATIGVQLEDQ